MNRDKESKLKQLVTQLPRGTVYTSVFLKTLGYDDGLLHIYKKNGWIVPVGRGAWRLSGDKVGWAGALAAVQEQLKLSIHVGGKTIIEEKGYGHYMRPRQQFCFLYGEKGVKLPAWFIRSDWGVKLRYVATELFPSGLDEGLCPMTFDGVTIVASTLERAAFEMLYYVPQEQGYDEAQKIMDGLLTLRPALVQQLLETCRSIKVKRLFMVMAEAVKAPWLDEINTNRIDFGNGVRQIIPQGGWNKKYQITIPQSRDL